MARNTSNEKLNIWTVGHSTRALADFLGLLHRNRIEAVADVRSLPGSRKFPQFNAEALAESLPASAVDYISFKEDLGGRRKTLADSKNTVWRNASFRGYADYMETAEFKLGIDRLSEVAQKNEPRSCAPKRSGGGVIDL